jgi:glutathione synthase/RimK-type ligase-like ATP-grasp enzyme
MKKILILNTGDDWNLGIPDFSEKQFFGYNMWGKVCEELGIELYRASVEWYENKFFSKGWIYKNGNWKKVDDKITPDVIYDKTVDYNKENGEILWNVFKKRSVIERRYEVVNGSSFNNLFNNKANQSVIFDNYLPKTEIVEKGEIIKNKNNEYVVLKKFNGSGGYQVEIKNEQNIGVKEDNIIKQKFIDARDENGILRDYRFVFVGDSLSYVLSRVAKEDSLFTNMHQGAKVEFIKIEDIEEKLLKLVEEVKEATRIFRKKNFSLDFLKERETGKYYLIEMNTKPGVDVFDKNSEKVLRNYFINLTKHILDV